MKKALVIIVCAVGLVYICIFAKIKSEQPKFLDTTVTLAQQNVTIEKIQGPINTTENRYFKITNHFLSKERYEFQGNMQAFAVAEIQKKTEKENLEAIKLRAEQEIEKAKAKKQSIELSGAITEVQKAELELQRQVAQYKWESIGKGLAGIKLPTMLTIGDNQTGNGEGNSLDRLIGTMTLEKLENISK